ncbi:hypothetical protein [Vallitalea longa]|uniref:hypothetical protein n=1 Tax=Vallitalea longa TaxID=2936439 RepID=UPI002492ABFD|nr:hypothetical protein [Vallitalea longa]
MPLHEIHNQDTDNGKITIDWDLINANDIGCLDGSKVEKIIINNINIQICLGMLFPFKDFVGNDNFRENIGFISNKSVAQKINEVQKVFTNLVIIKYNGEPCAIQVSIPSKEVFQIFNKLSIENKLNQWVRYFLLRKPKDDVTEVVGYEFILQSQSSIVSTYRNDLNKDEFFNYFRFNKRNMISKKCIPINGFTLDEVICDPYISAFNKIVKKMYVYTSEGIIPSKYDKFITWIEN